MIAKKKRGPAPTGRGKQIVTRIQPDQLMRLDAWIEKTEKGLSRPEAIRRMVDRVLLADDGVPPPPPPLSQRLILQSLLPPIITAIQEAERERLNAITGTIERAVRDAIREVARGQTDEEKEGGA